ncbi:hypothetical protein EC973_000111 [Apophysomyces ossiformis]|uniref:Uncharacterized protein n=1 Tax=Apophysomyces ossiformis TaxID=679940 RepID=A0A8H7EUC6_9FUNG|nr:hypothetical protein EC973_000111 [Apophysomyces ossiformis]
MLQEELLAKASITTTTVTAANISTSTATTTPDLALNDFTSLPFLPFTSFQQQQELEQRHQQQQQQPAVATVVAAPSSSLLSPSSETSTNAEIGSRLSHPNENNHSSPPILKRNNNNHNSKSSRPVGQPGQKSDEKKRTPADIYDNVKAPFNYAQGFHDLIRYVKER